MVVTFAGAVVYSGRIEKEYTPMQRRINSFVELAPNLLGRFEQQPQIVKIESFVRDGVPLTPEEIVDCKRSIATDAICDFHAPYPSLEEMDRGSLRSATVSFGPNGLTEIESKPYDPLKEKMEGIDSIDSSTKEFLGNSGIGIEELKERVLADAEPLKMANRVNRITHLLNNFNMPEDAERNLLKTLRDFTHSPADPKPETDGAVFRTLRTKATDPTLAAKSENDRHVRHGIPTLGLGCSAPPGKSGGCCGSLFSKAAEKKRREKSSDTPSSTLRGPRRDKGFPYK